RLLCHFAPDHASLRRRPPISARDGRLVFGRASSAWNRQKGCSQRPAQDCPSARSEPRDGSRFSQRFDIMNHLSLRQATPTGLEDGQPRSRAINRAPLRGSQVRTIQGFKAYVLTSERVRITVVPELGARIISLKDLQTGREWLWHPASG